MGNFLKNKVQFVICSLAASGVYQIVDSKNIKDAEAKLLVGASSNAALSQVTQNLWIRDSSDGLLMRGQGVTDIFKVLIRSELSFIARNKKSVSLYLLNRMTQGLLFLTSQTSIQESTGYLSVMKLDRSTGRLSKKNFISFYGKTDLGKAENLWYSLSQFLKKMDQQYIDSQPTLNMLLETFSPLSVDYQPKNDHTVEFTNITIDTIKGDILFIGSTITSEASTADMLITKKDNYSSSVVKEGFLTDSKAKKSLLNFIDSDPFLKAVVSTTPTVLDGNSVKVEKVQSAEEVVYESLKQVESDKDTAKDVYDVGASWLDWWTKRLSN